MAEKKNKKDKKTMTEVEIINAHIKEAEDFQMVDAWKEDSERYRDYLKGRYYPTAPTRPKYPIGTVFNIVNLIVSSLAAKQPWITVKARRKNIYRKLKSGEILTIPGWRPARLLEAVLNKELEKIGFVDEVRKCIQDALIYGFAVLKVGYGLETESNPDIEVDEVSDKTTRVRDEGIFCSRVCPFDFLFDPFAVSEKEMRYAVHRVTKPTDDLIDSDIYDNIKDLPGEVHEDFKNRVKVISGSESITEFSTIYEYHDYLDDKIKTLARGSDKLMRDIKNPHKFSGSHFVILRFAGDNDDFRGASFIKMIEPQIIALNETASKMIRHLDLFPGQITAEQGAIDDDEMDNIIQGEQGSVILVQNGAVREGRVRKESPIPMGADYFNVLSTLQGIIDTVLGIPDYQRSGSTKRKTASEITYEEADKSVRREYFGGFVKDFILEAATKCVGMVQQYYTREQEVEIEGDTGIDFIKWTNKDIAGEFDLDLDLTTMRFMNQARVQQIVNLFNILGAHADKIPAFAKGLQMVDGEKLMTEIFDALDLNFERFKKDSLVPHLELDPARENELARAGHVIPDPKFLENHRAHLDIHLPELEITGSNELKRHVEMHIFMDKVMKGEIDMNNMRNRMMATSLSPGAVSASSPGRAPLSGTSAGLQPNAKPAPTEPDLAGSLMQQGGGMGGGIQ